MEGHDDHKRRLFIQRPPRKVYETFTPLNQEISVVLVDMERRYLATHPVPQKNEAPMGSDVNQYCFYHRCKVHSTCDCNILKKDIENLIKNGFLKSFVARREQSRSPQRQRYALPRRSQ